MNRWKVYEILKDNKRIDIREIEETSAEEVKEGLIEYLIAKDKGIEIGKGDVNVR